MSRSAPLLLTLLAALLWAVPGQGAGKSVGEASQLEKKSAAEIYRTAMVDFDRNDLEGALKGFRESYGQVKSPNSHFMIARTLARLGRNDEAYDELNAVIAEADPLGERYAETVHAAYAKLEEIRPRVGFVVVTLEGAPKGTTVVVGDATLDPGRLGKPVPVLPGDTTVVAVSPSGTRRPETVHVDAGATAALKIDLRAPEKGRTPPGPTYHPPYRVELEANVVGETWAPPDPATRGAGAGVRASFEVVRAGALDTMDNLALSTGVDWIGTSTDPHFWIPAVLQWNIWLTPELSLRFEPGAALLFGAGSRVAPALFAGARYRIFRRLYITGRIGIPVAAIGAALLL